jgi:hypothetical protein
VASILGQPWVSLPCGHSTRPRGRSPLAGAGAAPGRSRCPRCGGLAPAVVHRNVQRGLSWSRQNPCQARRCVCRRGRRQLAHRERHKGGGPGGNRRFLYCWRPRQPRATVDRIRAQGNPQRHRWTTIMTPGMCIMSRDDSPLYSGSRCGRLNRSAHSSTALPFPPPALPSMGGLPTWRLPLYGPRCTESMLLIAGMVLRWTSGGRRISGS